MMTPLLVDDYDVLCFFLTLSRLLFEISKLVSVWI